MRGPRRAAQPPVRRGRRQTVQGSPHAENQPCPELKGREVEQRMVDLPMAPVAVDLGESLLGSKSSVGLAPSPAGDLLGEPQAPPGSAGHQVVPREGGKRGWPFANKATQGKG